MKNLQRRCLLAVVSLVSLLVLVPVPASAAESGFYVVGQLFSPLDLESTLDISSEAIDFGHVSMEADLGLDAEPSQERFRGGYRFGRRSAIELSYLSIARSGQSVITRTVVVPGNIPGLPESVEVDLDLVTRFDTTDVELSYKFFFLQREAGELGFSVGVHAINSDFSIGGDATASLPGQPPVTFSGFEADSVDLPLPVVGLHGRARLTKRVYLNGLVKFFDAEVDDYSGTYSEVEASLEIRLTRNLAVGVGLFDNSFEAQQKNADRMSPDLRIFGVDLNRQGTFFFLRFGA